MGQKVNPIGLGSGSIGRGIPRWFADDNYAGLLRRIQDPGISPPGWRRRAFRASSSSVRRRRRGLPSIRRGRAW